MSRAGSKAFNRCDVKIVEFEDFAFQYPTQVIEGGGIINPVTGVSSVPRLKTKDTTFDNQYAGSFAKLYCPRTEDERVNFTSAANNHSSRMSAFTSLREIAGELICKECRFSTMSPVEVAEERARLARAEADRIEALAALEKARNELRSITPGILPELTTSSESLEN